jgi:hypothetical protein
MARKKKARPKAKAEPLLGAARCLHPFHAASPVGPRAEETVTRTRRGRLGSANARKRAELDFVQAKLAPEAQRMADFAFALSEQTGRIPALGGTIKFKNIPSVHLAQALWSLVSSGVRGWISNRENDLADELSRLSRPSKKLVGPAMDRGLLFAALRAGAARGLAAEAPGAEAVRAAWARVQDRCGKPSWAHVPIQLTSNLLRLSASWPEPDPSPWPWPTAKSVRAAARAEKRRLAAGEPPKKEKRRETAARKAKRDKARRIPAPTHWAELSLPERSEWPEAPIEDWAKAVVDEPGDYESREDREARFAQEIATAAQNGRPVPTEPSHRPSGRKSPCKMQTIFVPLWLGKDFGELPGQLSKTVTFIPPRADKGRAEWEARLTHEIPCAELAAPGASRQALLAMDMGLTHFLATNVDAARVAAAIEAERAGQAPGKDAGEPGDGAKAALAEEKNGNLAKVQTALDFILSGWGKKIGPKIERITDIRARRQSHGLAARCEKTERMERELAGFCKTTICSALKDLVEVVKPLGIVLEDLDFQGPFEIKRRLPDGRVVKLKNKRMGRLWHRFGKGIALAWLESRGPVHGWTLYKENRACTSQQCSRCGKVDPESREGGLFECVVCKLKMQADLNAALVLEERFLWGRWLAALGPKAAGRLGLSGAHIERWMPPILARAAQEAREAFLRDGGRLAQAAGEDLLPPQILALSAKRSAIGGAANSAEGPTRAEGGEAGSLASGPEAAKSSRKDGRSAVGISLSTR